MEKEVRVLSLLAEVRGLEPFGYFFSKLGICVHGLMSKCSFRDNRKAYLKSDL